MVRLLIIADDFTGALDTGIQFAKAGIDTKVVVGEEIDFSGKLNGVQVMVADAETRHLEEQKAYEVVSRIVKKAVDYGVEIIYKKTDSALRGCIGAELAAVLDASGEKELAFLPALPKAGRTTKEGMQYVLGVPVHQSVFGKDPFEPVKHSYIPDIIGDWTGIETVAVKEDAARYLAEVPEEKRILIFDAETDETLKQTGYLLRERGRLRILAGCAGFAAVLPELVDFQMGETQKVKPSEGLLVVCGSLNPITGKQLDYAAQHGFNRISIAPERYGGDFLETGEGRGLVEKLNRLARAEKPLILDSLGKDEALKASACTAPTDELRSHVARCLGELTREWLKLNLNYTVVLTGGDTLLGFMEQAGCHEIRPLYEMFQGVVLSELTLEDRKLMVISKSGGFGHEAIFTDIADRINGKSDLECKEA